MFTSPETRRLLIERDQALEKAQEDDHPDSWRLFKNLRNICHKMLSKDKHKYITDKLDTNNNDHDKWEMTKDILGWKNKTNPTVLMDRGKTVTSPKQIVNALNYSMISKVATIVREIPPTPVNPLENYSKLMTDKNCEFKIQPVGIIELRKTVNKMKSSRSAGTDGLSMKIIQETNERN